MLLGGRRRPAYLKVNTNPKSRQTLTNLRTGSNNLRIETGRWTRPREAIEDRLCMECMNGSVEDEKHFLIECKTYDDLRERMFRQIEIDTNNVVRFDQMSNEESWIVLMKGTDITTKKQNDRIIEHMKKFVQEAMERRSKI